MESRHYILPSESLPRLELVCGTNWRYVHIRMDDTQVGSIRSAGDLLRGAEFFLPDGGVLAIKLIKQVGASELRVTFNGQQLIKPGLDRGNVDVRTAYQAVLAIGGVNLLFFCLTLLNAPGGNTLRWYDLCFGLAFLLLGWLVREGSGVALTFALVMYLADTLITVIAIINYRYYIAALDLSINIVLLFFMLRGYGNLAKALESFRLFSQMLRDTPEKRIAVPTNRAEKLPLQLQRVQQLLRQAVQLYSKEHQRERARKLVKEALRIAPTLVDGWYALAYMVERPDDRLRMLERVLAIDPFHAGANDALDQLRRGREYVEALPTGESNSTTSTSQAMLAQAADDLKRGASESALRLIKQVLFNDPQDADAWFLASFITQVPEERRAVLEQAVKYNPRHEVAHQALIRANAADTSFKDLTSPTWTPYLTELIPSTQLTKPNATSTWEGLAIRMLIGLLVVIAGLIFVVFILST